MTNYLQFAFIYKLYLKDNPNVAYIGKSTNINSRYSQHTKINRDRYNDTNYHYKTTKNSYNNAKNKERTKIIQLLQTNHSQLLQDTRIQAQNILQ